MTENEIHSKIKSFVGRKIHDFCFVVIELLFD